MPGQLRPAGALATVPPPEPASVADTGYVMRTKLAVADVEADSVSEQAGPLHAPLQPVNADTASGVAVSTTGVPASYVAEHVPGHEMPAGALVTAPLPVPVSDTVSVTWRVNVATTARSDDSVTVHGPLPLQSPLQPAKRDVPSGPAFSVTLVPESSVREQTPPMTEMQEIPPPLTPPPPLPASRTLSVNCRMKVAVTDWLDDMVTVQAPVPHAPLQPANRDVASGDAFSVTVAPESYVAEHMPGQLMPAGVLVTAPPPLPAVVTVSVNCRMKVAVTDCAADIGTLHAPVPVHAPLQPENRDVASGVAVSVTTVLAS